jgi:hypothetical protein
VRRIQILLRLTQPPLQHRVLPGRNLAAGLVELGLDLIGQLKLVLEVIIDPVPDLLDFLARQFWNRSLNFFDRAHGVNLAEIFLMRSWKKGRSTNYEGGNGEPEREKVTEKGRIMSWEDRSAQDSRNLAMLGAEKEGEPDR